MSGEVLRLLQLEWVREDQERKIKNEERKIKIKEVNRERRIEWEKEGEERKIKNEECKIKNEES